MREVEGDGLAGNEHESEPAIGEPAPALQHRKEVRDVERKLRRRFGQELVDRGMDRRWTSPRTHGSQAVQGKVDRRAVTPSEHLQCFTHLGQQHLLVEMAGGSGAALDVVGRTLPHVDPVRVPECQVLWPNARPQSPQTILPDMRRPKDLWPLGSTRVASQGNSLSVILRTLAVWRWARNASIHSTVCPAARFSRRKLVSR